MFNQSTQFRVAILTAVVLGHDRCRQMNIGPPVIMVDEPVFWTEIAGIDRLRQSIDDEVGRR